MFSSGIGKHRDFKPCVSSITVWCCTPIGMIWSYVQFCFLGKPLASPFQTQVLQSLVGGKKNTDIAQPLCSIFSNAESISGFTENTFFVGIGLISSVWSRQKRNRVWHSAEILWFIISFVCSQCHFSLHHSRYSSQSPQDLLKCISMYPSVIALMTSKIVTILN